MTKPDRTFAMTIPLSVTLVGDDGSRDIMQKWLCGANQDGISADERDE
jgi:hypothetical protein